MPFVLDQRLESSSFFIEDWDLCRVALKNDKTWPWLYLVPRRDHVREIYELSQPDRSRLVEEISMASRALKALYNAEKINTAALGNMVPQLHIHVFARFKDDPAWPRPVWTVQRDEISYTEAEKDAEIQSIKECFEKMRTGDGIACRI